MEVTAAFDDTAPKVAIRMQRVDPNLGDLFIGIDNTGNGVAYVMTDFSDGTLITATLRDPDSFGLRSSTDVINVSVCFDAQCLRPVSGSPFRVTVNYRVEGPPALSQPSPTPLTHDVVDVAYSPALDALVVAANQPAPALWLVDAVTGASRSVPLGRAVVAVAVSPDGRSAAVGHDGAVSVLDLAGLSATGSAVPRLIGLPTVLQDLVLDARGHVFATSSSENGWVYGLDTLTGEVSRAFGSLQGSQLVLRPDGGAFYAGSYNLERFSTDALGPLERTASWAYSGTYNLCGKLWLSPDGQQITTACGHRFTSAAQPELDMRYSGRLQLSGRTGFAFTVIALSEHTAEGDIALLEEPMGYCGSISSNAFSCFTNLTFINSATLLRSARYRLAPLTVQGQTVAQRGRFLAHRADGAVLLLSELPDLPDPTRRWRLTVLR